MRRSRTFQLAVNEHVCQKGCEFVVVLVRATRLLQQPGIAQWGFRIPDQGLLGGVAYRAGRRDDHGLSPGWNLLAG
jgi:hypothetical protein